jgi:hypothetical protein
MGGGEEEAPEVAAMAVAETTEGEEVELLLLLPDLVLLTLLSAVGIVLVAVLVL